MQLTQSNRHGLRSAALAAGALLVGTLTGPFASAEEAPPAAETTAVTPVSSMPVSSAASVLDRIRTSGKLTLGYRSDARPFSFSDEGGKPAGYAVALCLQVADALKTDLTLPSLAVTWQPVTAENRFRDLERGAVDLLCGPDTVTLARRATVSFSIAIFPGGVGALLRSDAANRLVEVLTEGAPKQRPLWRRLGRGAQSARLRGGVRHDDRGLARRAHHDVQDTLDHDRGGRLCSGRRTGDRWTYFTQPESLSAQTYRGGPDQALVEAIDRARLSVDMAVYDLNLWSVRDALLAADQRGVTVRLVVESDNIDQDEIQELKAAGIPVLGDRREGLMHDKFTVIDRLEVWTGSMNDTLTDTYRNNNNLVRMRSARLAEDYTAEFEEMFVEDRFGPGSPADTP